MKHGQIAQRSHITKVGYSYDVVVFFGGLLATWTPEARHMLLAQITKPGVLLENNISICLAEPLA